MATVQTINSGSFIGETNWGIIGSDSIVLVTTPKDLICDAFIRVPVILYGSVQVTKPETEDLFVQTDVSNPIPSAPTSLVAVDAGLGDAINLSWVSSASSFNVYKKVGIVYTKLNPNALTEGTSYLAGGLTTDVPVDFVVRALNGIGQESGNSNIATATPTLSTNAPRFTNPTYAVHINGTYWATAILESVELGFGNDLSTASFTLPVDPRGTTPGLNEPVIVYINGRLLFQGYTTIKTDSIDENGLVTRYTCHSNIIDLIKNTLYSTDVYSLATVFNATITPPDGFPFLRNFATADKILSKWGISGGPSEFPGHVDVTDQTRLAAAELVLSRIGNYRLYHDMETGATSVYQFGSGGTTIREFQFSKNIVSYKIDESFVDVVKQVTVIGGTGTIRKSQVVDATVGTDPDGRLALAFSVNATNIRDIQVYGMQKAKPSAIFDDDVQVCLADFESFTEFSLGDNFFGWVDSQGNPIVNTSNDKNLYPMVKHIETYKACWTGLGAKIAYHGTANATVYLTEAPKMWKAITKTGNVKKVTIGKTSASPLDTLAVEILLGYDFTLGTIKVEYTYDVAPPVIVAGSGEPSRTITDSQYQIVQDPGLSFGYVSTSPGIAHGGSNNTADTLARMRTRALAELAQHNVPSLGGNITVIGDETINLRSAVRINGQSLEISHVSHSFQNGYTTTVTLTNEPFVKQRVFHPMVSISNQTKDLEKNKKTSWYEFRNATLDKLKQELASQKDAIDKQAPFSGKYAIWGD